MKKNTLSNNMQYIKSFSEFDDEDPLSHFNQKFYIPKFNSKKPFIYFAGNSLGLQSKNTEKYIKEELEAWKKLGVDGHTSAKRPWLPYHELLTPYTAEIVGSLQHEIVVMNSLTVNLHLLMVSFYNPKGKRKKILIEKNAFPSDRYAVESQIKFHGNNPADDLILIEPDKNNFISLESINKYLEKYGEEIALVLIGGVNYYTGQAFDMESITIKAQNYGCKVGFDLAHAAGNLKIDLHNWGVDFASWCGYKYLNGGPGAPSGVYIHEKHLDNSEHPRFEGWWGHDKKTRFSMPDKFVPLNTAEAWQLSNPPILSMSSLLSSLEIFHEANIDNLVEKSKKLTYYLETIIKSELSDFIQIITPSFPNRGCQLSLKLLLPIDNIIGLLHERGVICDYREPDVIRIAPVPLYNSFKDCYSFVNILKNILHEFGK